MIAQATSGEWLAAAATIVVVGALLIGSGWLVMWVANRAADGKLGPNAVAGIRTKATMASPEAWLAAHQRGRRLTVGAGWTMIITAVLSGAVGFAVGGGDPERLMLGWVVAVTIGTVVSTALVIVAARQGAVAARRAQE